MTTGLETLELLPLQSLDAAGKPPRPSRLPSAAALRSMYQQQVLEDQASSTARARVDAMKGGEPPFNPAALAAAGQSSRANANFLTGQKLINRANSSYIDIITSTPNLVSVNVESGDEAPRHNRILDAELSRSIRKWSGFTSSFMRMVDLFTTHGVGIAHFPDTVNFRFEVTGFGDFLVPRQTIASEERIVYATALKDTLATELYAAALEDEAAAVTLGWNPAAVRAAINRATTRSSTGEIGRQEEFQRQVKNNDLYWGGKFPHIPVIHGFVREFDGSISYFQCERDGDGDFLFKHEGRYKSTDECFIFFCYGIGNGTFHSIRGLGHMIYSLCQLYNRMMCQIADGAMAGSAILLEADSGKAIEEMALQYFGPYAVLSPGMSVVKDRAFPNLSTSSIPALGEVKSQMNENASQFTAPSGGGGVYQNRLQTEAGLDVAAGADSGSIDLFYSSWDRLLRQMVYRIINGPKSDPIVKEFHQRIAKQGITRDILKTMDHDATVAVRAFGAGNPAARSSGFMRLMQVLPNLDEIGRKRLIHAFVSDVVGYQNASYFAADPEQPRLDVEAKVAEMENIFLLQGNPVGVNPQEMHATHVQVHIPALMEVLNGIETGQMDPIENLQGLQAALEHLAAHGEQLAMDPTQAGLYGQVKEVVNNMQQVVTNMDRKIKAMERQQAEGSAPAADGQPQSGASDQIELVKLAREQFKFDLERQKGELEIAFIQSKQAQSLALADASKALQLQKQIAFPGTGYQERR